MRHPLETLDCQLSHILGHVVHGNYSIEFLRAMRTELLSCYVTLDEVIKERELVSLPSETKPDDRQPSRSRGLLDFIGPDIGGAA
jgi:hypothetical protein